MKLTLNGARKALAALAAVLGVVITQFAADGTVAHWISIAISALGAIGVYLLPNDTATPAPATEYLGAHETPGATT